MKKIFIVSLLALSMVGCSTTKEKVEKEEKDVKPKVEQTSVKEPKKEEKKEASIYDSYIKDMDVPDNVDLGNMKEVATTVTNSNFLINDNYTLGEGLYSLYNDYTPSASKTNEDKVFNVSYKMKFDTGELIEDHEIIIKADFNTNKYQLISLMVQGVKEEKKEYIDNFLSSIDESVTAMDQEYEEYQEEKSEESYPELVDENVVNNANNYVESQEDSQLRMYINDFKSGKFYSNRANVSNVRLMGKLGLQAVGATPDGYVLVETISRTNNMQYLFGKFDYYWRLVAARNGSQEFDPYPIEESMLYEVLN